MAILKLVDLSPDPTEKTRLQLPSISTGMYHSIWGHLENFRSWVWKNPQGLTPQQVFDIVGSDEPLTVGNAIVALLVQLSGDAQSVESFVPENLTAKVNVDGTVSITNRVVPE